MEFKMQNSYTLEELAKFLNRPEKEIQKLAEKEVLKGRKIQGKWVFALADVALWMEQEMTEFEVEKTEQLEQAIIQSAVEAEEEISLVSILAPRAIDLSFSAKTKASVIRKMAELAENNGKLWDVDSMIEALRAREDMASTALENGVAIMHPRRPQANIIAEDFLALAVTPKPIPFGGGYDNETDVFFLLCCQTDTSYLRSLGKLVRVLKTPNFLDNLRECPDAEAVRKLIAQTEKELS
jgi:PTS system nitrogen regulatory IIA component